LKRFKGKLKKAINPAVSALLMVAIAAAAAVISYYYVMNYGSPPSTGPVEVIQIDNVVWSAPNKIVATVSNHGKAARLVEVAYVDGNRGLPDAVVEIDPVERRDVEFTFENNIYVGEHLVKVVCRDGTVGLISHRFTALYAATATTTTAPTTTPTTTTTTTTVTTATSPCLIVQAYYDGERATVLPAIRAIQSYRDNVVANSSVGAGLLKMFNALYYPASSVITPFIMKHPALGFVVRAVSSPLIALVLLFIKLAQTSTTLTFTSQAKTLLPLIAGTTLLGACYLPLPLLTLSRKNRRRILHASKTLGFAFLLATLTSETLGVKELTPITLSTLVLALMLLIALTLTAKLNPSGGETIHD